MGSKLRATVVSTTGSTKHTVGFVAGNELISTTELPLPKWVEILEDDGAFYLLYFNTVGECFTDTWHQTIEEAKAQAGFEFGIKENDWFVV